MTAIEEEFIAEKDGVPLHLKMEITRIEYERLIESLLQKTLTCVDAALTDTRLNANQIDKVILVGGATRTPLVHRLLNDQLKQPIHCEINPDLCVAMGAAIQGGLIAGVDVGPVLVDITPHTLGIEAAGQLARGDSRSIVFRPSSNETHRFRPLAPRCTKPCSMGRRRRRSLFTRVKTRMRGRTNASGHSLWRG